jgi:hypothetical protein
VTRGVAAVVGSTAAALGLVGAVLALTAGGDDEPGPAATAVAGLPTVTDFTVRGERDGCVFDEDRGGLVHEGLTVGSRSSGVLELTFHVQRDSLDDVLPSHVSTVLTFDEDTREHTFDLVLPLSRGQHEAGYDECHWSTGRD